jgi:CHRD domain-containing protein
MRKTVFATGAVLVLSLALVAIATGAARDTYKVSAKLTPGADVPKPKGASGASGSFSGKYVEHASSATLTWKLSFTGMTGPVLQAHIHMGKPGVSGNVIVPLCGPCKNGMTGSAKISESVIKTLEAGKAYVNVHTKRNPAGEIRGQVKVAG